MSRQSQTEILKQLLPAAAPGMWDEELDDVEVRGPRGGMRGYTRAPGAARLGDAVVTRTLADNAVAATVRHGDSYYREYGFAGKKAKTRYTGPTFAVDDVPAVTACAWAAWTRDPEVLALLTDGDAQAVVAKAVERHAAVLAQDGDEDDESQALGM